MTNVIRGAFPTRSKTTQENKKPEQLPSYLLHVSITFSDPLIWRRFQVPAHFTLAQLHQVIQAAMGWRDEHIHQFMVGKISYVPTLRSGPVREVKRFDERNYQLHSIEEGMMFMFTYLYDAGEGWEHVLHLEQVVPPTRPLLHPVLLSGERACPPEEVGDVHEYNKLVTQFEKGTRKDRHALLDLAGRPDFNPAEFDLEAAKKRVEKI